MKFSLEGARDLYALIRGLTVGLKRLSFEDNFESFKIENVEIPANSEIAIGNKLTYIPSKYIITSQTGNGLITKGTTSWTTSALYVKNNGAETVKVNISFLR